MLYVSAGCMIALLAIMFHSVFDYVFHVPANAVLFFIILALLYRIVCLKESPDLSLAPKWEFILQKSARASLALLFSLILIFLGSWSWRIFEAERIAEDIKESPQSEMGIDAVLAYTKNIKKIDQSIALNPLNSAYLVRKADFLVELATRDDLKKEYYAADDNPSRQQDLDVAEKCYLDAVAFNPTNAEYHLKLSRFYAVLKIPDPAVRQAQEAMLLNPKNRTIESYAKKYIEMSQSADHGY